MNPTASEPERVKAALTLLGIYAGAPLVDDGATRARHLEEIGVSSLALASVVVELEERLDREFDFAAFANVRTVGDLLAAVGLG